MSEAGGFCKGRAEGTGLEEKWLLAEKGFEVGLNIETTSPIRTIELPAAET
jgi:hypothetical protein